MINASANSPPLYEGIAEWLQEQGLHEASTSEIVQGLGKRLVARGISLHRLSLGGMLLHPVFGALDVVWNAQDDLIRSKMIPRSAITTAEFQDSPFFRLTVEHVPNRRFRLDRQNLGYEFPIFETLRSAGVTEYMVFHQSYGRKNKVVWANFPPGMEGVIASYATRQIGGFSDEEADYLQTLSLPLALAIKATTSRDLTRTLLETYLGRYSGTCVLDGLVERGDGTMIDCILWYCDMRNSTAMAEQMSPQDYLATFNDYFDCTAGAVLDHGGEVLKFIGDAVMAIFPFEGEDCDRVDRCRAAVAAVREALSKARVTNAERSKLNLPPIRFGISLHIGHVMFGNVGTAQRLDVTVLGLAANKAARLEDLCKILGTPLIVSSEFANLFPCDMIPLGTHEVAGIERDLSAYTLSDLESDENPRT